MTPTLLLLLFACDPTHAPRDPQTAERQVIDRFSDETGTIFRRSARADLPGPGEPIDFDRAPFLVRALGPDGEVVEYYNFDVRPQIPQPLRVLVREGEAAPVEQGAILDAVPGDSQFTDLWQLVRVIVPRDYVANTITSVAQILDGAYPSEHTDILINCPLVPEGSTAVRRIGGPAGLTQGWYRGKVVFYFTFGERQIRTTAGGAVPLRDLYVTFAVNLGQPGGGGPSGYKREEGSPQTHNVLEVLPADARYSPLWRVRVYDNAAFDQVHDLSSARAARLLATDLFWINAPVVSVATP